MGCGSSSNKNNVYDHTINLDLHDNEIETSEQGLEAGYEVGEGAIVLSSSSKHRIETIPVTVQKQQNGHAANGSSGAQEDGSGSNNDAGVTPRKTTKTRKAVFARGFSSRDKNGVRAKTPKTDDQMTMLLAALSKCYLFSDMSDRDLDEVIGYMWKEKVKAGSNVVTQGKKSDLFYVIQDGEFEMALPNGGKTTKNGDSPQPFFGENALLFPTKATGTIKCVAAGPSSKHARLWAIDRTTFRTVVTSQVMKDLEDFRAAVASIPIFRDVLTPAQCDLLASAMQVVSVKAGQRVVSKGEHGDVCYFIQEGTVVCSNIGDEGLGQLELSAGSYFGERALITDEPRAADVDSKTDTLLLAINRNDFNDILGPLRSLMDENMKTRVMEAVPILQQLPESLRKKVMKRFEMQYYRDGEVIVQEGDVGDRFYIVRSGIVDVLSKDLEEALKSNGGNHADFENESPNKRKNGTNNTRENGSSSSTASKYGTHVATLKEGDWFGEMALLNNEPRTASCLARGDVECLTLSSDAFKLMRSKSELLLNTSKRRAEENRSKRLSGTPLSPAVSLDFSKLQLSHLSRKKILGKGTFGTVFLSETSSKAPLKGVFALKAMSKAHIVTCDQTRNVVNEKKVLEELSHPFIVQLFRTFQDKNCLYMLLEFVPGGELFSIMQLNYRLPLSHAQFYAACIIEAFDFMHSLDIIYRDLKPENVLIDRFGYGKIADFGFAKRVQGKTYTLCGTPEYLAPEVVLGKGHDKGVDLWGVGVLIYEILAGISPFADEYSDDQIVVCKNIVNGKVDYNRLENAMQETEMNPPSTLTDAQVNYVFAPAAAAAANGKKERKGSGGSSTSLVSSRRPSLSGRPAEHIIRKLLIKNPTQRLGCSKDGDIKKHAFFSMDNEAWEDLRNRRIPAPYVPTLNGATDTSNFDDFEPDGAIETYTGPIDWCRDF